MHLNSFLRSCCLLLFLGALPAWAAHDDPIEKVIEGFSRGLSNAEREVGKALEGINNGITQAGREVEKVFNGLSNMGSQAGKEVERGLDKVSHGINNGVEHAGNEAEKLAHGVNHAAGQGAHQGGYTGQHGGAATTTAASGASVNKPFINFSALWRSIANIMP
ncbi:suprabasin isoform X2 [Nannospalax galili]|uniref:Suprabasin n=1 Tax=Nannospalax galili TaxID=1026970 RepID=A0A8C6R2Z5_NANGA|nr:suprabasin isoform X2 [Nannospalax galili]